MRADKQTLSTCSAAFEAFASSIRMSGFPSIAEVKDGPSTLDLALLSPSGSRIVVRCVLASSANDYEALCDMLAGNDFDRGILVYCDKERSYLLDAVETWHIDEIGGLVASLSAEATP